MGRGMVLRSYSLNVSTTPIMAMRCQQLLPLVLSSRRVNIAENPIVVMGSQIRSGIVDEWPLKVFHYFPNLKILKSLCFVTNLNLMLTRPRKIQFTGILLFTLFMWEHKNKTVEASSYILRRPQNFAKSSPYSCPMQCQSEVRGRFRKILQPSQNF